MLFVQFGEVLYVVDDCVDEGLAPLAHLHLEHDCLAHVLDQLLVVGAQLDEACIQVNFAEQLLDLKAVHGVKVLLFDNFLSDGRGVWR